MRPPRVLVSAPYAMPVIDRYRTELESHGCDVVVAAVNERLSEEELLTLVADIDGIICGDDRITDRVLAAAPRLKVISKWGTGIDSIDSAAAAARGVKVCNTPGAFSEPVADTVMAHILQFARRLEQMNVAMRAAEWRKPQLISLGEATLGIIGVGNCGRAVARRASAFGMRLLGHDLLPIPAAVTETYGLQQVPLETLLRESDFITLHTTLNPTSEHLIDRPALALMKPGAILINTSRGPVVDESALAEVLANGKIGGAALDVFEVEPLPAESPLRRFPNCWLQPHNANSSPICAERVHQNTIENLVKVLQGRS